MTGQSGPEPGPDAVPAARAAGVRPAGRRRTRRRRRPARRHRLDVRTAVGQRRGVRRAARRPGRVLASRPVDRFVWGGYYEEGSMIWRSRWVTNRRHHRMPGSPRVPRRPAPRGPAAPRHRRQTATPRYGSLWPRGPATADTALTRPARRGRHLDRPRAARCTCGGPGRPAAPAPVDRHDGLIAGLLRAGRWTPRPRPGDQRPALPGPAAGPGRRLATPPTPPGAQPFPTCADCLEPRDARRSATRCSAGLTSASGGMVAAATTSLPERAEAGRNYDYRYVWIRDQCYAGQAAAAAGAPTLLDDAVRFVTARLLDHGDPPDTRLHHHRARPSRTSGTWTCPATPAGTTSSATGSTGSSSSTRSAKRCCCSPRPAGHDRLDTDHWQAAEAAADAIDRTVDRTRRRHLGDRQPPWTHSRLTAAAGLRADRPAAHAGAAVRRVARPGRPHRRRHRRARGAPRAGGGNARPTTRALDAALLLPALRGAVPADDPRTTATLPPTCRSHPRRLRLPVPARRPAAGRRRGVLPAVRVPGRPRPAATAPAGGGGPLVRTHPGLRGPAELYSEEYDVHQHQMRGNLPQAFVHALHLETAARLTHPPGPLNPPS